MRIAACCLAVLLVPARLIAQDDCFPSDESNEARTLAIVSVPLALAAAGSPPASFAMGLEAAVLPHVPDDLATPTACRPGKGPENANPLPGFLRIRVAATVASWTLEAGWIPPVRVDHVRANLLGVALGREFGFAGRWVAAPRVHALIGALRAPVTCNDDALSDASSECFGGSRSNDRLQPGIVGGDVTVSRRAGRWVPHLGAGYTFLRPRFQVDFTNALGVTDRRRVSVDLERVAVFGGISWTAAPWAVTAETYATLGDRPTARLVVRRAWPGR